VSLCGGVIKFVKASGPRSLIAALSYTIAASSAVSKVPNQSRTLRAGSRISAAHFPHGLCRTPRNFLPLVIAGTFTGLLTVDVSPAGLFLLTTALAAASISTRWI
ncbi:hypothetical protein KIW84_052442, partial [Lathyrus oleraceus]